MNGIITGVNTILLPVIAAVATASITLLASGQTIMGLICLVIALGGSYIYHIIP